MFTLTFTLLTLPTDTTCIHFGYMAYSPIIFDLLFATIPIVVYKNLRKVL